MGERRPPAELAEFCERMWPRLVGSLSLYARDPDLAEELAQEALLRVCRDWRRVRMLDVPEAWAHRVALNLANSHFRRRLAAARAASRSRSRTLDAVAPDPVAVAVRDAVATLPERERAAVVLRYHADLSVVDAARVLGCPPNTVKTLTRRGLERLRRSGLLLDEPGDDAEPSEVHDGR